jgi:hypothetical protein
MKNVAIIIVSFVRSLACPSWTSRNRRKLLMRCDMVKAKVAHFRGYGGAIREAIKRIKWYVPIDAPS